MMMRCVVPRRLVLSRNWGRQRSSVIRRTSPLTPTKLVSTAPLSTSTASTEMTHRSHSPPASAPRCARRPALWASTSGIETRRQRQDGDRRIEKGHREPHVAQRLGKHALGLLFHVVGRTFKTRDPQQRRGKAEEHGLGETRPAPAWPCFPSNVSNAAAGGDKRNADHQQHAQRHQVRDEDGDGHFRRFGDADDRQHHEQAQQPDRGQDDRPALGSNSDE